MMPSRKPTRKAGRIAAAMGAGFIAFVFLNNTNFLRERPAGEPILLAHRGLAQRFDTTDLRADTCTASRMLPPVHPYLENTLPSIRAAFELGADIVEIDIHPTTDGDFAVFHDWTVDCRTEGQGVTRDHTLAALKSLDIGHGYTADGGATFPFRGQGRGLMPSLDEVFAAFPDRDFLLNIKSNDPREGELLAARLAASPYERRAGLMAYGGDRPIAVLRERLPALRVLSRAALQSCVLSYIGFGWTGYVPESCRHTLLHIPLNVAPWLWGWPGRFLDRMESAGSRVFLLGDYHGGWSTGIDTTDDLARLPAGYSGGIVTDAIEIVGPAIKRIP